MRPGLVFPFTERRAKPTEVPQCPPGEEESRSLLSLPCNDMKADDIQSPIHVTYPHVLSLARAPSLESGSKFLSTLLQHPNPQFTHALSPWDIPHLKYNSLPSGAI